MQTTSTAGVENARGGIGPAAAIFAGYDLWAGATSSIGFVARTTIARSAAGPGVASDPTGSSTVLSTVATLELTYASY